jgi:histidyl-tRNA synthetase
LLFSSVNFGLPRGMRDLESEEFYNINYIREKFLESISLFDFKPMEPSPMEMLSTFEAKGGPNISNEIYNFSDKAGRKIALRFDLTIGLTRFVTSRRDLKMPVKIAAFGGVWRYDEPQAGRYRYFHQWDIEIFDLFSNESDAEIIEFVSIFFKKLGLGVCIEINDRQLIEQFVRQRLGITDERMILEMFRAVDKVPKKGRDGVLTEYKDRIQYSLLQRLIDLSKTKGSIDEVIQSQRDLAEYIEESRLLKLMDSLKSRRVDNVRINLGVVRGLDYYSGIVFETFDPLTGTGALVGGGRYDNLSKAFGRKDIGATGAAGGVERLILALGKHGILRLNQARMAYVAYTSYGVFKYTLQVVSILRNNGIATDYDLHGRTLRKQLDEASIKGAFVAVIISPDEIERGQVTIRHMKDGLESKQQIKDIVKDVNAMLLRY